MKMMPHDAFVSLPHIQGHCEMQDLKLAEFIPRQNILKKVPGQFQRAKLAT